jgi:hypothetical protein
VEPSHRHLPLLLLLVLVVPQMQQQQVAVLGLPKRPVPVQLPQPPVLLPDMLAGRVMQLQARRCRW